MRGSQECAVPDRALPAQRVPIEDETPKAAKHLLETASAALLRAEADGRKSGRWKANSRLKRGLGSRWCLKKTSSPVDS